MLRYRETKTEKTSGSRRSRKNENLEKKEDLFLNLGLT